MTNMAEVKLEEYKMLRKEILYFMDKDTRLFTCLFASVTAVLFFALEWKIPEGCLLSFLVIIPIASKLAYHQKEMAKISEYMQHFLEPDLGIKWEMFLSELSIHQDRPKVANYMKFSECIMMAVGTMCSYIYLAWKVKLWEGQSIVFAVEIVILLVLFIWTMMISCNIYKIKNYRKYYKNVMDYMYFNGGKIENQK